MFGSQNSVMATVTHVGVRAKDKREDDPNNLMEASFETGLTTDLADDIGNGLLTSLFDKVKGAYQPKSTIKSLVPALTPGKQIIEVREHPEASPIARIDGVLIRRIRVSKDDANAWIISWTIVLGVHDKLLTKLSHGLGTAVYITMEQQQEELPGVDGEEDDSGESAAKPKRRRKAKEEQPALAEAGE